MTHKECKHRPTKSARSACRRFRSLIEYAQREDLEIEYAEASTDWITQVWIMPRDRMGSKLLLTLGDSLTVTRFPYMMPTEPVPARSQHIWISVIADKI